MKYWYLAIWIVLIALVGCENQPLGDPSARLEFSQSTLSFDTVFTHEGSAVRSIILRNPHKKAVSIAQVRMRNGRFFRLNMDGENDLQRMTDIQIAGGDSLFLFVRATIAPDQYTQPLLIEDTVLFDVGDHTEQLALQAYGWDVHLIHCDTLLADATLTSGKPYLIRQNLHVAPGVTLHIQPGAHLYMHDGASITCDGGSIIAMGQIDQRITIQSDRLDNIYDSIPYLYVGGKWDGIYAFQPQQVAFSYTDILSGNIGAYIKGDSTHIRQASFEHCRIHNHSLYGLVLISLDALVGNSEISNCAEYGAYVSDGTFHFVHTTIASYFNSTIYAIQSTSRKDSIAPLGIYNTSNHPTEVIFHNSILTGAQPNCLQMADPEQLTGSFAHNYIKTDTLPSAYARDIVYASAHDTVFVNTFYNRKTNYYNFRLHPASPAIGIADSLLALPYPLDLNGNPRVGISHPDAGCYQHQ